ncbi:hypothetical protein CAPTEDRAFT_209173 [Capitella teleta]|uniref:Uncharacterized protein n=1 Tax=Capitella teleta TaxID=283909 RepID=R7TD96_CAPTE|nr:hypothetical protein CAPTEDRAFT_209173 [Capitella teleta]|eukprot:ELT91467.1 hypothetical protein CAPTEDRAFT_209173 [Capitella teleta]
MAEKQCFGIPCLPAAASAAAAAEVLAVHSLLGRRAPPSRRVVCEAVEGRWSPPRCPRCSSAFPVAKLSSSKGGGVSESLKRKLKQRLMTVKRLRLEEEERLKNQPPAPPPPPVTVPEPQKKKRRPRRKKPPPAPQPAPAPAVVPAPTPPPPPPQPHTTNISQSFVLSDSEHINNIVNNVVSNAVVTNNILVNAVNNINTSFRLPLSSKKLKTPEPIVIAISCKHAFPWQRVTINMRYTGCGYAAAVLPACQERARY